VKITIESTHIISEVNGRPARVWRGVTDKGVLCDVFVTAIRVRSDADSSQFEAELKEIRMQETRVMDIRQVW
jgi:hypothetical protein